MFGDNDVKGVFAAVDTVESLADAWISGRLSRREIQPSTAKGHSIWLKDFIQYVGSETPIDAIALHDIERWLSQPKKNGQPYGAQSVNNRAMPVRALFAWAVRTGQLQVNPAAGIQRAKPPKRLRKAVAPEAIERMLWVAGMRDRTIILTAVQLGLRREELHRMNVEHWNRDDRVLYVVGKGDKERVLPVEGEIAAALERWTDMGLDGRRAGPMWAAARGGGDRLSMSQIGERVRRTAQVARVSATTHSLRHTCASDLASAGVPAHVIQTWMGHESLNTTAIYMVPLVTELRAVAGIRHYLPSELDAGGGLAA